MSENLWSYFAGIHKTGHCKNIKDLEQWFFSHVLLFQNFSFGISVFFVWIFFQQPLWFTPYLNPKMRIATDHRVLHIQYAWLTVWNIIRIISKWQTHFSNWIQREHQMQCGSPCNDYKLPTDYGLNDPECSPDTLISEWSITNQTVNDE